MSRETASAARPLSSEEADIFRMIEGCARSAGKSFEEMRADLATRPAYSARTRAMIASIPAPHPSRKPGRASWADRERELLRLAEAEC